jgi:long-subunit acyl-CoA synthetase (AMP-forming)
MQLPISEAFGMVEVGVMTYRQPYSRKFSSVGTPLRDVRFSFGADGELIAHRPHFVTSRYFQCAPGENENTFIGPNAVATGDLGYQKDGYVFLNGRKKEVIMTSGGLKIHPEVVEQQIDSCAGIAKSVVFSTGPNTKLNCVVLLNDPSDTAARQKASQFVAGLGAKSGLPMLNLIFASEPFTRENGLLRPNMKIDRRRIAAVYKQSARELENAATH